MVASWPIWPLATRSSFRMADKVKKDWRDFAPWAGFFAHPKEEPEAFATLPGWRQREIRFVLERQAAKQPLTIEDYRRFQEADEVEVAISLPASITLAALHSQNCLEPPDARMLPTLQQYVQYDWLLGRITALGEGRQLVRQRPSNGLVAYIWLLSLVRKKILKALPVTAFWELEEGIYELTGEKISVTHPSGKPLLDWLDSQVTILLAAVA